jgi:hypothetical protein
MYMLELIPAEFAARCRGWRRRTCWRGGTIWLPAARRRRHIFAEALPQIAHSLQHMELFHHAEKRLLEARGILETTHVREAGMELRAGDVEHIDFLNSRILKLLDRLGMPRNPPSRVAETLATTQ